MSQLHPHRHRKPSLTKAEPSTPSNVESNLITAVLAGSGAAVVQTLTTYPFEFVKTGTQLYRDIPGAPRFKFQVNNWKEYFLGCNGLAVGNALKAASRFIIFNQTSKFMSNENGKTTAPRVVIAGVMTGGVESLWVIPFENIKTTSIQNYFINEHKISYTKPDTKLNTSEIVRTTMRTQAQAQDHPSPATAIPLRGGVKKVVQSVASPADALPATQFLKVAQEIYRTRGFGGFWQGSLITATRQIANSAVWFSSFNALKQLMDPTHQLSPSYTILLSILSSVNVVLLTQPIDVVKTRVQSKNFRAVYKDTLTCLARTAYHEGLTKLWSGWLPRFFKVSLSGAITAYSYKAFESGINLAMNEHPFQAE